MHAHALIPRLKANACILSVFAMFFAVRSTFWHCRPIWDGAAYYYSLVEANDVPFDLLNFTCDEHICQGFFLVMSVPCRLFKGNYYLFNVWLTIFGAFGVMAFYRLLLFFTRGRARNLELALVTSLFAFHPSILSCTTHFNLDIGILTFLLWYWLMLLKERVLPAIIFGVLLIFSKETALVLLPFPFLFCCLYQPRELRCLWLRRYWQVLAAPYFALTCFLIYKSMIQSGPTVWIEYHDFGPFSTLLHLFKTDAMFVNYAGFVFLLNFNWIVSLLWVGWFLALFIRRNASTVAREKKTAILLLLLFACSTCALFLVRPYSNVRYLMVLIALMLLGLAHLILTLPPSLPVRTAALIGLLGLMAMEDFRTVDPVSRAFFGTFSFGHHELLWITRRTREEAGYGGDQLVYNMEFEKLEELADQAIQDLNPSTNTIILHPPGLNWLLLPRLDKINRKPTCDARNSFTPRYGNFPPSKDANPSDLKFDLAGQTISLRDSPADLYYLAFPTAHNDWQIQQLSLHYAKRYEKLVDLGGYQVNVIRFTK